MLLGVYGAGLVFASARTATRSGVRPRHRHAHDMCTQPAVTLLTLGTVLTTIQAEILVVALEPALQADRDVRTVRRRDHRRAGR